MGRRYVSDVHKHFNINKNEKCATCKICHKKYATSGNTTNLNDHLKRAHPTMLVPKKKKYNQKKKSSEDIDADDIPIHIDDSPSEQAGESIHEFFFSYKKPYENESKQQKMLEDKLTFFIVDDCQPFSIVETKSFRELVNSLDARFVIPSRWDITHTFIPNQVSALQQKLKEVFKSVDSMALTCDLWTSNTQSSYMAVTSHFIFDKKLVNVNLATRHIGGNHTSEAIATTLRDIMMEWSINEKAFCVITDNAANMIAACKLLQVKHMPCFAHNLNLVLRDGIENPENEILINVLNKCKTIVNFFKSSNVAADKLKENQKLRGKPELKVINQVPTRWNSWFHMIERLLEIKEEVAHVLLTITRAPPVLTAEDDIILQEVLKILQPFLSATKQSSGSEYVTESMIIPLVHGICIELKNTKSTLCTESAVFLATDLLESISRRLFFYEQRPVSAISTCLDPRFKKNAFRSEDNFKNAHTLLLSELSTLTKKKKKPKIVYK